MVVEARRYLADLSADRIHDADHERVSCRLGDLRPGHVRWYDRLEDALVEEAYEACPWCFGRAGLAAGLRETATASS
jgi:hypothetical protein